MNDKDDTLFPEIEPPATGEFITLLAAEDRPRQAKYTDVPPIAAMLTKPRQNRLWCPYCGRIRQFKKHAYSGTRRCEGCGISNRDFAVRQTNGLWLNG